MMISIWNLKITNRTRNFNVSSSFRNRINPWNIMKKFLLLGNVKSH